MGKNYTSFRKRLELLRSRNMSIPKESSTQREIIKKYNHYNLINGYKDPFLQSNSSQETFITGTSPRELEALYKFDQNMRFILLRYLLPIEESVKHELTQAFYSYHTNHPNLTAQERANLHKESEFLKRNYYDLSTITTRNGKRIDKMGIYNRFVTGVYSEIGKQYKNKNDSIHYYSTNHGYLPMWVLMNILTMGNISKFFIIQKKEVKLRTMNSLRIIPQHQNQQDKYISNFEKLLNIITLFRNVCAHNERLYCFKHRVFLDDKFMDLKRKLPINISKSNKNNVKSHLYSIMFIISIFLSKSELTSFKSEIVKQFKNLDRGLSSINLTDIKQMMHLDFDWNTLLKK